MKKNVNTHLIIIVLYTLILALTSCTNQQLQVEAENNLQEIHNNVAKDAEEQFKIAVKGGDKIEIYSNASLVAEAYKQAKDEENYLKWKQISDSLKTSAGLNY